MWIIGFGVLFGRSRADRHQPQPFGILNYGVSGADHLIHARRSAS